MSYQRTHTPRLSSESVNLYLPRIVCCVGMVELERERVVRGVPRIKSQRLANHVFTLRGHFSQALNARLLSHYITSVLGPNFINSSKINKWGRGVKVATRRSPLNMVSEGVVCGPDTALRQPYSRTRRTFESLQFYK